MFTRWTIEREVSFSGIGVHSGRNVAVVLKPSSRGKIIFRRTDLGGLEVEANPQVSQAGNCTSLDSGTCRIRTIEHLMAVLFILGIGSLEVETDGEEIPILDGSAAPLVRYVLDAGVRAVGDARRAVRVVESMLIEEGKASLRISPGDDFVVRYAIEFPHPLIRRQALELRLGRGQFINQIAPARTFGFLGDVSDLRRRGLALGGSFANAVVLDESKVISGPLRYPDEFVRHKVLDFIGDLALFGYPLLGRFEVERGGHRVHLAAVRTLVENPDLWVFEDRLWPSFLQESPPRLASGGSLG